MKRWIVMAALLGSAAGTERAARADDSPWSKGVPKATQDRANALYEEGNQQFAQRDYAAALEKYRAAIAIWDHPQIELNAAVALIRLDKPLEAAEAIDHALRFLALPFKPEDYQKALDYQALLKGQVGELEVSCTSKAAITLDGKPWFVCPGTQKLRVLAGQHTISGEQPDYVPLTRRVVVGGGATTKEQLMLISLESAVKLEYPVRRWIPWTVAGGGAGIALAGLGFYLLGRSDMRAFEDEFRTPCAAGCPADLHDDVIDDADGDKYSNLRRDRDRAKREANTIGIPLLVVGGVATVGGLVLAIINRPRRVLPDLEVAPSAGGATASVGWSF